MPRFINKPTGVGMSCQVGYHGDKSIKDEMMTNKQLQEEINSLRSRLCQEREDHRKYEEIAYKTACESMRVKMVLEERRDGNYEALTIVRLEKCPDGVNVVVGGASLRMILLKV